MTGRCIEFHNVTVSFGDVVALNSVSFSIEHGERVALLGPSGAGKSTILSVLNGTVSTSSGAALFDGAPIEDSDAWRKRYGALVATVPQQLHLSGRLRAIHNVNAGRLAYWSRRKAVLSLLRPREVEEARAALANVGLAHKLHERTDRLSGGEQQRVAIARALRQEPMLIVADEPSASLDPARAREVMDLLTSDAVAGNRTLVVSQHDAELARATCDRIIAFQHGRVVFDRVASAVDRTDLAALYAIDGPR
jgi:phosphonate transport system ATP-binding protein